MAASGVGYGARSHRFIRRVTVTLVMLVLGALASWPFAQDRVGEEIRREFERRLSEHYPGFQVMVREARLIEGRGVEIRGVSLRRRPEREPRVAIDEIFVTNSLSLETLLRGEWPETERVLLRGLRVRGRQDAAGNWDLQALWPLPRFSERPPPIQVREARVKLTSHPGESGGPWEVRDVDLDLEPPFLQDGSSPEARGAGGWHVRGQATSDVFSRVQFSGQVPVDGGHGALSGVVEDLRLEPALYAALPEPWRGRGEEIASLRGLVRADFQVTGDLLAPERWDWNVRGTIRDGLIVDSRLPQRLYDVDARFDWNRQRLSIERFFARNGQMELRGAFERRGWGPDGPMLLLMNARRLQLNRRFIEFLPEEFQGTWRKFFPAGRIDVQLRLAFDGQRWDPAVRIECDDLSFVYHRFPYRLERTHGVLTYQRDLLAIDLQAMAGGQRVTIRGRLHHPGQQATGWVEIACPRPIPLDDKLLDAVAVSDPAARSVVHALNPGGTLAVSGRFEWRESSRPTRHSVRIDLHNCTMQYDRFPYPFAMIHGTLYWDNQGWRFHQLTGRNDSGYIECEGHWRRAEDGSSELVLDFVAADVPLEEQLRQALNPAAQQVWKSLQPHGAIDHLNVRLRYASAQQDLSVYVQARKWKKRPHDEGRSISVRPQWFPYRLDDVTGVVTYHDGEIRIEGLSARHDQTVIQLDGHCQTEPGDGWTVELSHVVAERLRFDPELLAALPDGLGSALGRLNLRGDLSLQGALALRGGEGPSPARAWWDLALDIENGSLNHGLPLENIHGDVRLVGQSRGDQFFSRGELNIDSLISHDLQVTQIRGPFLIEPQRVRLGIEAEGQGTERAPRSIVGRAIGGQLAADAVVYFQGDVPFRLRASLERGDLQLLVQELELQNQEVRGQANALIHLTGTAQGRHTWRGDGLVRLYEADIYQVPFMLALLKLLSIRQPDRTAFTSGDIDFRLEGEHLYFDQLNFHGDAISLKGHGDMSLDRQVNLQFYTLVGRREWDPPLIGTLLQQAAQRLLLIHATGPLDDPYLTREPLPMLKETLEQLFPEVVARNQTSWRPEPLFR